MIEEADESEFWLEFIIDENLKPKELIEDLKTEAYELASIFIKSRKTAQKNLKLSNQYSTLDNHHSTIQ